MTTPFTAFYPLVQDRVGSVPTPVLFNAVLRSAREFCDISRAWRIWLPAIGCIEGQGSYSIDPTTVVTATDIVAALYVALTGPNIVTRELIGKPFAEIANRVDPWNQTAGLPQYATRDHNALNVYPPPSDLTNTYLGIMNTALYPNPISAAAPVLSIAVAGTGLTETRQYAYTWQPIGGLETAMSPVGTISCPGNSSIGVTVATPAAGVGFDGGTINVYRMINATQNSVWQQVVQIPVGSTGGVDIVTSVMQWALQVRLAIKPDLTATSIDDLFYYQYGEPIADGAAGFLKKQPSVPWSDPLEGNNLLMVMRAKATDVKGNVEREGMVGRGSVRPRRFQ